MKLHSDGNAILLLGMSDFPVTLFEIFVGSLSLLWRPVLSWSLRTHHACEQKTIAYVEGHDQCFMGDHPVITRLLREDMYRGMMASAVCVCVARAQPAMMNATITGIHLTPKGFPKALHGIR
jgi:hypothetical protein